MPTHTSHPTGIPWQGGHRWRPWPRAWRLAIVAGLGLNWILVHAAQAKTFHCGATDTQCLIDSITAANASGKKNTISLEAGTYTLVTVAGMSDRDTGLPSITGDLTIQGAGADLTTIERTTSAATFRLIHIAATGTLTLEGLTLSRGNATLRGGAIMNDGGILLITDSILAHNSNSLGGPANTGGGAIYNTSAVTIIDSILAQNSSNGDGGALHNTGAVTIADSILTGNSAFGDGGAIYSTGMLAITNSTLSRNGSAGDFFGFGGAIRNLGTLTLLNSTLADNSADNSGGRLANRGTVYLQNTMLARNTASGSGPDCVNPLSSQGTLNSQGNNLIGDPTGCIATWQGTDLTGNPGLGPYTDDDTPGNGHFPLLSTSPAINAGNPAACPKTDQLGEKRVGICDIGAIEFQGTAVSRR